LYCITDDGAGGEKIQGESQVTRPYFRFALDKLQAINLPFGRAYVIHS
jgi:hypothetical protein